MIFNANLKIIHERRKFIASSLFSHKQPNSKEND